MGGLRAHLGVLLLASLGLTACEEEEEAFFTDAEWEKIQALANPADPTPDTSNKYLGNAKAEALGKKFYFDPGFSGNSTLKDMLGRDVPEETGRAPKGQPTGISCATCHDVSLGGTDHTSKAGVSVGVGAYDVNSMPTINAAYQNVFYWNGRNDSLWAQILAVTESPVSMGSTRLKVAWRIADAYRAEYEAVFSDYPLPMAGKVAEVKAALAQDGQCTLDAGACPSGCVEETSGDTKSCWPRFPLQGKPGTQAGCQRGDATESFGDAFDCMSTEDQAAITRVYVNFAKAIVAYEYKLISRNSHFDKFVKEGPSSTMISASARRGLKLFVGKAICVDCHKTPNLSDGKFHNIAVPQSGDFVPTLAACPEGGKCDCVAGTNCLPWGFRDGLGKLQKNKFVRTSGFSDDPTGAESQRIKTDFLDLALGDGQKGQWRTPGLRDVELTAPYMHTGEFATLLDVLKHYNAGGASAGVVGQKDAKISALNLEDGELQDLEAFLLTLSGEALATELTSSPTLPVATEF